MTPFTCLSFALLCTFSILNQHEFFQFKNITFTWGPKTTHRPPLWFSELLSDAPSKKFIHGKCLQLWPYSCPWPLPSKQSEGTCFQGESNHVTDFTVPNNRLMACQGNLQLNVDSDPSLSPHFPPVVNFCRNVHPYLTGDWTCVLQWK